MTATRAERIGAEIEALAGRFRSFSESQAVRAYLLREVSEKSDEDLRLSLGLRGNVGKIVARGRILVRGARESQLISMGEMRAWLGRARTGDAP